MIAKPKSVSDSTWNSLAPQIGRALVDAWAVVEPTVAPGGPLIDVIRANHATAWLRKQAEPGGTDQAVIDAARSSATWVEKMRTWMSGYEPIATKQADYYAGGTAAKKNRALFEGEVAANAKWFKQWPVAAATWGKAAIAAARKATEQQPWSKAAVAAARAAIEAPMGAGDAAPAAGDAAPPAGDTAPPPTAPAADAPVKAVGVGGLVLGGLAALGVLWVATRKGKKK